MTPCEHDPAEPLAGFRDRLDAPASDACADIAEQAARLLEDAWVHLPDVPADVPADVPVHDSAPGMLRRLGARRPRTEAAFHEALLSIFATLGDGHTQCYVPGPRSGRLAFLPFLARECFEQGQWRLAVTSSAIDDLHRGDLVISWNGVPVADVIARQMAQQPAANTQARRARAVQTLTFRPLDWLPLPESDDVRLEVEAPDRPPRTVRATWHVADGAWVQRRFAPYFGSRDDAPALHGIRADIVETSSGAFGHIRIASFERKPDLLLAGFLDALASLPPAGLLLDVRGCEQGIIASGEQLLQLFAAGPIEPQPFRFRITELIRHIVRTSPALAAWSDVVEHAARRGERFSEGRPLTSPEQANHVGRRYHGRVVVLCDALTYSTAEMLAAGFQDHGLGLVVGTAPRTGGGGGSPWSLGTIHELSGRDLFRPMPGGPQYRVAVRQSHRVRARRGVLLEAAGVVPDVLYRPTHTDLLRDDAELFETIGRILTT
jgi:hypothetical protein